MSGVLSESSSGVAIGQDRESTGSLPDVLELLFKETPRPDYDSSVPAVISGRVLLHDGGKTSGAKHVSVTDGYSVVKTNAHGVYTLKPNTQAVFIYITRPAGYDVQGHWYKPLAARVDFELKAADVDEDEYIFVHVTDTHVSQNRRSLKGLSRFVREVNALTPQPRFVVNSGDLLNLHKALLSTPEAGHADFRNYVGIMNHLTMPHYSVSGDHTDSSYRLEQFPRGDHRCGKPLYWEYLGPNFFSFEYGRIHFVSVDFGYHLGQRQILGQRKEPRIPDKRSSADACRVDATGHGSPDSWHLRRDDVRSRSGRPLPRLRKRWPGSTTSDFNWLATSMSCLTKQRSVPYRSGGALAGCWWNPKAEQLCPDLSPQGYLIYRVVGDKLDHFYKGLGQRVAIVSHRVGTPFCRARSKCRLTWCNPVQASRWSTRSTAKTGCRCSEIGRPFYRVLYQATVDTTSLADGLFAISAFEARATKCRTRERSS